MLSSRKFLFLLAFVEGATVMAVELTSGQMLAPYFGAGLYTWGAVIGITIFGLAVGYYCGGIITGKYPHKNAIYWTFLTASLFVILMPVIAKSLTITFLNINPITAVVIIGLALLFPALVLLGTIPSQLIQHLAAGIEESGKTAGHVFTISTFGGILSVFTFGFYFIPHFGLTGPIVAMGLIAGIIGFFALLMQGKIKVLAYFLVIIIAAQLMRGSNTKSNIKVLSNSEGLLGQVMVADINEFNRNDRALFVNRMGQTFIDRNSGRSRWSYVDYITAVASILPQGSKVLLLGLGGGTVANQLSLEVGLDITAVELDERMEHIARKYFNLSDAVKVLVDDARHYLESTTETYDLIIFDVFRGEVPPSQVLSLECFQRAKTRLNDGGFLIINFNGFLEGSIGRATRSVYKTMVAAGLSTHIMPTFEEPTYRNCIFLASEQNVDYINLRLPLNQNGVPLDIQTLFIDPSTLNMENAVVLTDNYPLLEHYNTEASRAWREDYNSSYTKMFTAKGVGLFE